MLDKCPYCGSRNFEAFPSDNKNTHYALTMIDMSKNPPSFLASSGTPVDIHGCKDCKGIVLTSPIL